MPTDHKKTSFQLWGGVFLFIILAAADQLAKSRAKDLFFNRNFAFSIPLPAWLMYLIYFFAITGIIVYCARQRRFFGRRQSLAWLLIFTGAILNTGERALLGYVRDFIYIHFWRWVGIYNLADFYIIFGIILLLIPPTFTKRPMLT